MLQSSPVCRQATLCSIVNCQDLATSHVFHWACCSVVTELHLPHLSFPDACLAFAFRAGRLAGWTASLCMFQIGPTDRQATLKKFVHCKDSAAVHVLQRAKPSKGARVHLPRAAPLEACRAIGRCILCPCTASLCMFHANPLSRHVVLLLLPCSDDMAAVSICQWTWVTGETLRQLPGTTLLHTSRATSLRSLPADIRLNAALQCVFLPDEIVWDYCSLIEGILVCQGPTTLCIPRRAMTLERAEFCGFVAVSLAVALDDIFLPRSAILDARLACLCQLSIFAEEEFQ
mmetsp:Transcript_3346/g.6773  ORF Transcript_3346/g.6773 Transcript_3346/m.6773 type:complete len:288 (-) Transcript_3346:138-1001(-)